MNAFNTEVWEHVPFHFWSVVFFVFGSVVGSFLNVVIHRVPREQSIVSPPSHCPHCQYAIPWYLNVPLLTWLWLRGKCANCGAPISVRYFMVEAVTGLLFLGAWFLHGPAHPGVAVIYCLLFAGLIAATFIDFEHFIIPESITIGGIVAGFLLSALAPALHGRASAKLALEDSFLGIIAGAGAVYFFLRGGKLLFGRKKLKLPPGAKLIFKEETLQLPEEEISYGDLLYRKTDYIEVQAAQVLLGERVFENVLLRLYQDRLEIGKEKLDPGPITRMEVTAERIVVPQEAMGLGDVKFMGAIGAFLGWPGVTFSLVVSSIIGSVVGVTLIILKKLEWSKWIPYGPYIALAAILWAFWGGPLVEVFFQGVALLHRLLGWS